MYVFIVGTGAMGKILYQCAIEDEDIDRIELIEPSLEGTWPEDKPDLIIDFSHPRAIKKIYDYCRQKGGNIPIIIGTTGYTDEEEEILRLLEKICKVNRKSNFSKGMDFMYKLAEFGVKSVDKNADVGIMEIHHKGKKDCPSGTLKTIEQIVFKMDELSFDKDDKCNLNKKAWLRLGNVVGEHKLYFAFDDELVIVEHRAYSKRIFAIGAISEGKKMVLGQN